jgi:hypothetical protein
MEVLCLISESFSWNAGKLSWIKALIFYLIAAKVSLSACYNYRLIFCGKWVNSVINQLNVSALFLF